jgi:WD40 repeat protein
MFQFEDSDLITERAYSFDVSSDSKLVLIGDKEKTTIYIYEFHDLQTMKLTIEDCYPYCDPKFSSDSRFVAFSSFRRNERRGPVYIWNIKIFSVESGKLERSLVTVDTVRCLQWSVDDKSLFVAIDSALLQLDSTTGAEIRKFETDTFRIWNMKVSLDEEMIAFSGQEKDYSYSTRISRMCDGFELLRLYHRTDTEMAFSPDGKYFAEASSSNVILYEVATNKLITLSDFVYSGCTILAFSPDSRYLVTSKFRGGGWTNLSNLKEYSSFNLIGMREPVKGVFAPNGSFFMCHDNYTGLVYKWYNKDDDTLSERQRLAENASIAWQSAAVVLASFRANSKHRFRDSILQPDMLPVILEMATPPRTYNELKDAETEAPDDLFIDDEPDYLSGEKLREERESFSSKLSRFVDSVFATNLVLSESDDDDSSSSSSSSKKRRRED